MRPKTFRCQAMNNHHDLSPESDPKYNHPCSHVRPPSLGPTSTILIRLSIWKRSHCQLRELYPPSATRYQVRLRGGNLQAYMRPSFSGNHPRCGLGGQRRRDAVLSTFLSFGRSDSQFISGTLYIFLSCEIHVFEGGKVEQNLRICDKTCYE